MVRHNKYCVKMWMCILLTCLFFCGCSDEREWILVGSDGVAEVQDGLSEETQANYVDKDKMPEALERADGKKHTISGRDAVMPMIQVYVCGAVKLPGVVLVTEGSRVEAALHAAGGFLEDADVSSVNLAAWLEDGQMLYFPTMEESRQIRAEELAQEAGLVNLNTADVEQLCTLPGIGESRALDIIAYREANGGFVSCEEIMQVNGIKESIYGKIKDKIVVK